MVLPKSCTTFSTPTCPHSTKRAVSPPANGRTLADNAPEAMLSLVTNMAVPSGLRPAVAKQQRANQFPYVVPA